MSMFLTNTLNIHHLWDQVARINIAKDLEDKTQIAVLCGLTLDTPTPSIDLLNKYACGHV